VEFHMMIPIVGRHAVRASHSVRASAQETVARAWVRSTSARVALRRHDPLKEDQRPPTCEIKGRESNVSVTTVDNPLSAICFRRVSLVPRRVGPAK